MQENHFYDTSVLVYAYNNNEKEKQSIAKDYLQHIFGGDATGVVSTQVLAEFFNVMTTKFTKNVYSDKIEAVVRDFLVSDHWIKINYNDSTLKRAISNSVRLDVQIWDALIVETMKENGLTAIITENEKDFRKFTGIKAINPFK